MKGYVAVTDTDWYRHLASLDELDEANFWTPNPWGGEFGVLDRGQPLLFKLKSPHNAIVGGGFYEHYTELPIGLAWDAFGEKNGVEAYLALQQRIGGLLLGAALVGPESLRLRPEERFLDSPQQEAFCGLARETSGYALLVTSRWEPTWLTLRN